MKTSEMIEANNQLRVQLNTKNKNFYENILVYIRIEGLTRDENKMEVQLLNILQDIIDAQNDGLTAEEYFGKNPKELADEILLAMPSNIWEGVKLALYIVAAYIGSSFLPSLMTAGTPLDVGALVLCGIYSIISVIVVLKYVASTIYTANRKMKNKYAKIFVLWFTISLLFAPLFIIKTFVHTPIQISLDGWIGIIVIIITLIIGLIFFFRQKDKTFGWPVVIFLAGAGIMGIVTRIPAYGNSLLHTKNGRYLVAGITTILFILFCLFNIIAARKLAKQTK